MTNVFEATRRLSTKLTHRVESLPILALNVHTACNCRCVMCDIWRANANGRELTLEQLDGHLESIRRLRVQRVMLTGGEPLLNRNLWRLCERLRLEGMRLTLVSTGLLIERHLDDIAANVDELVVSIDGAADVHDAIRRVPGGFERIARGLRLLTSHAHRPRITARSVVQRLNCAHLAQTIEAVHALAVDRLSFLAADVSSTAFNRPLPWSADRVADVALSRDQLPLLAASIEEAFNRCRAAFDDGFVAGGAAALWRIHGYFSAIAGVGGFPRTLCNAPWVSAVLEPDGRVRPCFFLAPYPEASGGSLETTLNSPDAIAFRQALDIASHETCQRCVCTISVKPWTNV
jgi:MoaA/NifB/PqqE/SkfB family radical SAM enzyme